MASSSSPDWTNNLPQPTAFFHGDTVRSRIRQLDAAMSIALFTPLIVLFWHGVDGVFFKILLQYSPGVGAAFLLLAGTVVQVLLSSLQNYTRDLTRPLSPEKQKLYGYLFHLILILSQIAQFLGIETLCWFFFERTAGNGLRMALTSAVLLTGLQLTHSVIDVPLSLTIDCTVGPNEMFYYQSYHSTEPGLSLPHLLDAIATAGVIQSCVHAFVIGVWTILDGLLGLDPSLNSCVIGWLGGVALLAIFITGREELQEWLQALEIRYGNIPAHLVTDYAIYVVAFAGVGVWRSTWVFFDLMAYYFPIRQNQTIVTPFYETLVAYTLLVLCHISHSLACTGFSAYDIERPCHRRLPEPTKYLSYFFDASIAREEGEAKEEKRRSQAWQAENTDTKNGGLPTNGLPQKITRQGSKTLQKQSSLEEKPIRKRKLSLHDLIESDRRGPRK